MQSIRLVLPTNPELVMTKPNRDSSPEPDDDLPGEDPVPARKKKTPAAELRALCDQFPPFPRQKLKGDQEWLATELRNRKLSGFNRVEFDELVGKIVAVYDGEVVAVGDDEIAMRIELCKKYQTHPGRFVLQKIDGRPIRKAAALGCSVGQVAMLLALVVVVGIAAISAMGTKANATFSKIGSTVK